MEFEEGLLSKYFLSVTLAPSPGAASARLSTWETASDKNSSQIGGLINLGIPSHQEYWRLKIQRSFHIPLLHQESFSC